MARTTKHTHKWIRSEDGDRCKCGITWLEWTRGFGSNVTPLKKKPEPLIRPNA